MSEEYNGWKNRETWAVNLWVENDQESFNIHKAHMMSVYRDHKLEPMHKLVMILADAYQEYIENKLRLVLTYEDGLMRNDIGSLYRVDWHELARYWVESVLEESTN